MFLPPTLIPACTSCTPAILMMYSAYQLNKHGNNIQPFRTPFPIWDQSVVPCPVLTVASWPAYKVLKRKIRWSGIPISLRIFQARIQQVNRELPDVQAGFRKGRGTRDQIANIRGIMEKQTGSKVRKEYIKVVYCHPAYLTSMQSISCKTPA